MNVVAYGGKRCCEEVESNEKINKYLIGDNPFNRLPRKLFLLYAPFKVIYQVTRSTSFVLECVMFVDFAVTHCSLIPNTPT